MQTQKRIQRQCVHLRDFSKGRVEVVAVVAVYILFMIVGLHTQTAAIDAVQVEILSPSDGAQLQSSPVELAAIVTNQKGPLFNLSVTITVVSLTTSEAEELAGVTNKDGTIKVLFPAQSGKYAWYVTTKMEGYPTIVSTPRSFSTRVTLKVLCLNPCSSKNPLLLPSRYSDLQVMVTDMDGNPVESANVTFYVNSIAVYSELTNPLGTARVHWSTILPASYTWFASASKDGEVGASRLSTFVIE